MRGIILEGIPAVGKTRILAALRQNHDFARLQSVLMLSEHYTERAIEHLRHRPAERYEQLMHRLLSALEPLRVMTIEGRIFEGNASLRLRYVMERFHLTNTICHAAGASVFCRQMERHLRMYQPVVVLCVCDDQEIEPRLRDTIDRRPPCWQEFLFRHGADWPAVAAYYAAQQRQYQDLLAGSMLASLTINVSHTDYETAASQLAAVLCAPQFVEVDPPVSHPAGS